MARQYSGTFMSRIVNAQFALVAVALALLLAACGSDGSDAEAAPAETSTTATTATTTSTTATSTTEADTEGPTPPPTEAEDTRTFEEIAVDQLDLMIVQLGGSQNLEALADCVIDRLESEEITLTGQGSPELAALLRCNPDSIHSLIMLNEALAPVETIECLEDGIGEWIAGLPLAEASTFFDAPTPPDELISQLSASCGVAEPDVAALIG